MYIDLVSCKHSKNGNVFLFQAPAWSHLKKGDDVIVDTIRGEHPAFVVDAITVDIDSDTFNFIVDSMEATLPLKRVLKKFDYKTFEYEEDENVTD